MGDIKIPVYPDGFFDFSDGVDISDVQINQWLEEARTNLEYADAGEFAYICSGNTLVIVLKHEDEYRYVVTKAYADASEDRYRETRAIKKPCALLARWRKRLRKNNTG